MEKVVEVIRLYEAPSTTLLEPKSIPKIGDPDQFISFSLGDLKLDDALCDFGSSVNVITFMMVTRLEINNTKPHPSSIMYVDASSKCPLSFIEDYPLQVGNYLVPMDFKVVEMVQNRRVPLLQEYISSTP